jgi:hypothetical protein
MTEKLKTKDTIYTCNHWSASFCWNMGLEDKSHEYGQNNKYYRHYCTSKGLHGNLPCIHAMKNGRRLVPRRHGVPINSVVRTWKVS